VGRIRIGCSGWSYPHWRKPVYGGRPEGEWLAIYAERFPTVEVNATFYRLPSSRMVAGWAERSPEGEVFAVKMSRYLTHVKRLGGVREGGERLVARVRPLADAGKLGPLLWQLPETFHRDDERLDAALRDLPTGRNCFEFRHPSWFCDAVYERLAAAGAALVVGDHPTRPFQTLVRTADWAYIRFHHGTRGVRGGYSPGELRIWAERIADWTHTGDVYAYFNNDWLGTRSGEPFAIANARTLMDALGLESPAAAATDVSPARRSG
jgi:uncharacterized protein YecE (DUF72 family)